MAFVNSDMIIDFQKASNFGINRINNLEKNNNKETTDPSKIVKKKKNTPAKNTNALQLPSILTFVDFCRVIIILV